MVLNTRHQHRDSYSSAYYCDKWTAVSRPDPHATLYPVIIKLDPAAHQHHDSIPSPSKPEGSLYQGWTRSSKLHNRNIPERTSCQNPAPYLSKIRNGATFMSVNEQQSTRTACPCTRFSGFMEAKFMDKTLHDPKYTVSRTSLCK